MILFEAKARCARCKTDEPITSGSVGLQVRFRFDDAWSGLEKVAVFQGSGESVDVFLTEDTCAVPGEVLATPGSVLTIGVYGTDGTGELVIPTIYAEAGRIFRGAEPSEIDPEPPTPTLLEQILAACQAAQAIAQSIRNDADSGVFDGDDGVSPEITITNIPGGHRVTVTDAEHPDGQSFDVLDGSGGGGSVTVDDEISGSSTNPVQNKVIKAALDAKGTYSKPSGGIPKTDLASDVQTSLGKADTALQQHQSLSAYRTAEAQDVIDNTKGTYSKPSGGIPKTDLASDVQTSLGKADTALQQHQSLSAYRTAEDQDVIDNTKGTYSKPSGGIPKTDLASDVQTSLGKADTALQQHQDISGKLDKSQGVAHAGEFCVVGSDGNITTVTMTAWQGGSY